MHSLQKVYTLNIAIYLHVIMSGMVGPYSASATGPPFLLPLHCHSSPTPGPPVALIGVHARGDCPPVYFVLPLEIIETKSTMIYVLMVNWLY